MKTIDEQIEEIRQQPWVDSAEKVNDHTVRLVLNNEKQAKAFQARNRYPNHFGEVQHLNLEINLKELILGHDFECFKVLDSIERRQIHHRFGPYILNGLHFGEATAWFVCWGHTSRTQLKNLNQLREDGDLISLLTMFKLFLWRDRA